jgi:hypothetical protein
MINKDFIREITFFNKKQNQILSKVNLKEESKVVSQSKSYLSIIT